MAVHELNKTTSKAELPIGNSGTGIEIKSGDREVSAGKYTGISVEDACTEIGKGEMR